MTTARVLMFQGTGSDVGKSTLVAGLCRLAKLRGIKVAPFKPQNMSNNAAVCPGGGEIGRAQALQARASGLLPSVDMNPVLLKPQTDKIAQVIVRGYPVSESHADHYIKHQRGSLMPDVLASFERLTEQYDLILVEGAGSASETNLRRHDIANMGFASRVQAPVCLVADIDRGGVIASLVGTKTVLDVSDSKLISSFIINKFRGDVALFTKGLRDIESRTGWQCHGILPWLASARSLPQEDAVVLDLPDSPLQSDSQTSKLKIVAPLLSRIANFDDMDPLRAEPNVSFSFIPPGTPIPLDADAIILPGTKSTLHDLAFLKNQGWHHDIIAFARAGGHILGICGGYQLLGNTISDPEGLDGLPGSHTGLGLLDTATTMASTKTTRPVEGRHPSFGTEISGYEIHMGQTTGPDTTRPFSQLDGRAEGAINNTGRISGTYLHGLFNHDAFRQAWLNHLKPGFESALEMNYEHLIDQRLDQVAESLADHLDIDSLLDEAQPPSW